MTDVDVIAHSCGEITHEVLQCNDAKKNYQRR